MPGLFTAAPSVVDAHFSEASTLLGEGRLDEALEACKRVLFLARADERALRAEVYVRIAAIKQRQGKAREAAFNLDKAIAIAPRHRTALEGQVMLAVAEQRWADVNALGEKLLEAIEDDDGRLQALLDLATVLQEGASDSERSLTLLERARALRPQDARVLERLAGAYDRARRFGDLVDVLEAWAQTSDEAATRAARLVAAARVATQALDDNPRAVKLLDQALRARRDDPAIAEALALALEREGMLAPAVRALQMALAQEPRRRSALGALVRVAGRAERPLPAGAAAMALQHLGLADMDEDLLGDQLRPEAPLAARRALPAHGWALLAPPSPPPVGAVLAALEEAAIAARVEELRAAGRLPKLDPATRLDPATSTVSAVRAFGYAARVLGVTLPELYVLPDVPTGMAAVAAERPTSVVSRSLLSGRTSLELAFVMARHLAYHRPGARLALYYATPAELQVLLHAAVQLGRPGVDVSSPDAAAAGHLYSLLSPRLDAAARKNLEAALTTLDLTGRRTDLAPWLRHLELVAIRAGLLASGDVGAAARLLEAADDPASAARIDDLFAFATSDAYERLVRELTSLNPSLPPPPPEANQPPVAARPASRQG